MGNQTCPICKDTDVFNHAPDGRCDTCAEEFGCECGCFPSPVLVLMAEFANHSIHNDDEEQLTPTYTRDDDGRWIAHVTYHGEDVDMQ